jgi:hypothetical protein
MTTDLQSRVEKTTTGFQAELSDAAARTKRALALRAESEKVAARQAAAKKTNAMMALCHTILSYWDRCGEDAPMDVPFWHMIMGARFGTEWAIDRRSMWDIDGATAEHPICLGQHGLNRQKTNAVGRAALIKTLSPTQPRQVLGVALFDRQGLRYFYVGQHVLKPAEQVAKGSGALQDVLTLKAEDFAAWHYYHSTPSRNTRVVREARRILEGGVARLV